MKKAVLTALIGSSLLLGFAHAQTSDTPSRGPGASHHERMQTGMQHMNERGMTEMMQHCQRMMEQH
ncbi:hypothetical protein [Deinococcus peraridilitoris]|uniref:Uncharacterized protein n=1 Tax=Deinococcus peraridilitoris (strain DSM 19664 / LMG 22246 / CIP 109416 / KR-200) TaxID=937777 RepID=L0A8F3_DEIPD|nr:hypothetical protein [Deinococcus peraridilitoris]AFZ69704.1 hypothetical protein Deipe_4365 [Deinococcus peraridilitoris DSM 19664]